MSSRNNRGLSSRDGGGCNSWTGGRVSGSCHSWGKSKVDIGSEACWSDGPSSSVGHWQGVVVVALPITTEVSVEHPRNTAASIEVTLAGITIEVSLAQ